MAKRTKKKPQIKVKAFVQINAYMVISDAVERAVAYGWRRAHKHTDTPDETTVCQEIENAVINDLCEILMFPDRNEVDGDRG